MLKSHRSKHFGALAAFLWLAGGVASVRASGPIDHITILGLSNGPTFTAGVATNTVTTTVFINTFAVGNSTPDAGEVVQLQLLDDGEVIPYGISPSSFVTQGGAGGSLNGGNTLPITFFRAGTNIQLRAICAADTEPSDAFTVVAGSATKMVVYGEGMTPIPGTDPRFTTGLSGTFTPKEPNQTFAVTVVLTDQQFNRVSRNDTVSFASGDLITLPAPGALSGGTGDFNVVLTGARITRTIVVTDVTDGSVASGSLDVTTAGPPTNEVFPFPSPFNPHERDITFRFRLSDPKDATVIVTDLFGQELWRNTVSGTAGFNDIRWNGRNEKGAVAPVGVYYVLVEIGGSIESKKRFGVTK